MHIFLVSSPSWNQIYKISCFGVDTITTSVLLSEAVDHFESLAPLEDVFICSLGVRNFSIPSREPAILLEQEFVRPC